MEVERHGASAHLIRPDGRRISLNAGNLSRTRTEWGAFCRAWELAPKERLQAEKDTRITVDVGRDTGSFAVVKAPQIRPQDPATFSKLLNSQHDRPSRVIVSNSPAPPTTLLTLIGEWNDGIGGWKLRTVYPGHYVPPQPWDLHAIHRMSLQLKPVVDYWCRSAFLWSLILFRHQVHDDTMAGLMEDAARIIPGQILEAIGYEDVRRLWVT